MCAKVLGIVKGSARLFSDAKQNARNNLSADSAAGAAGKRKSKRGNSRSMLSAAAAEVTTYGRVPQDNCYFFHSLFIVFLRSFFSVLFAHSKLYISLFSVGLLLPQTNFDQFFLPSVHFSRGWRRKEAENRSERRRKGEKSIFFPIQMDGTKNRANVCCRQSAQQQTGHRHPRKLTRATDDQQNHSLSSIFVCSLCSPLIRNNNQRTFSDIFNSCMSFEVNIPNFDTKHEQQMAKTGEGPDQVY